MSDYPEHDKLSAISDQSQACGEFVEWLNSRGISLMTWREDLTDQRLTDPECPVKVGEGGRRECDPSRLTDGDESVNWWRRHCTHWQDGGDCHRCGKGKFYQVTGIRAWTTPDKNLTGLLAEFFNIDQAQLEAEKRAMLTKLREAS